MIRLLQVNRTQKGGGNLTFCKDFGGFLLRNALDLLQSPSRGVGDGLDGLKAAVDDQLDITLCETRKTLFTEYLLTTWQNIQLFSHGVLIRRTSNALMGVGAPGPVMLLSSPTCSSYSSAIFATGQLETTCLYTKRKNACLPACLPARGGKETRSQGYGYQVIGKKKNKASGMI